MTDREKLDLFQKALSDIREIAVEPGVDAMPAMHEAQTIAREAMKAAGLD
jgi:hypothetical protein